MYAKGRRKGTVRFSVHPVDAARRVAVAGDFNGWRLVRMRRQRDGGFAATVEIPTGRYQYKFLIDDHWVHDADVQRAVLNCYGTLNSVAVVD